MQGLASAALLGTSAWANIPPQPPILTISIFKPDQDAEIRELTEADLKAMPPVEVVTSTPWTKGIQRFEGVSLHYLLEHLNIDSGTIQMFAVNDYTVEIPITDASVDGPIIAYSTNDKPMSLREKGPLWLIYPYDSSADFRSETIYSRSIWQLNKMVISP